MKPIKINACFLLISIILASCTAKNIKTDYRHDPNENKGLIVASLTQDTGPGTTGSIGFYYINDMNDLRYTYINNKSGNLHKFTLVNSKNEEGRLLVFDAPAGRYKVASWLIDTGLNNLGKKLFPKELPDPIEFEVEKGKITYIGNLHMKFFTGKNIFGITLIYKGYPIINDEFDRDYSVLQANYPSIKSLPVLKHIPHTGPWVKGFKETQEDKKSLTTN